MTISIPAEIGNIIEKLENNGYEAWLVGGCVRDMLIGIEPYDYDITTNALPEEIMTVFDKTIPTGIKHGTVTVVENGVNVEITTFRSDGEYQNHRKPKEVSYVKSIDLDLKRRDFTVNAICYNPAKEFYDPLCAINDLNKKTLKAIGDPDCRFKEDALRILRLFRFSAQLDFSIEAKTKESAINLSYLLKDISAERIFSEISKGLSTNNPNKFTEIIFFGGLSHLGFHSKKPIELKNTPNLAPFRLAVILFQTESDPQIVLSNMKCSNAIKDETKTIVKLLGVSPTSKTDIKKLLAFTKPDTLRQVFEYKNSADSIKLLNEIVDSGEPYNISMLNINGDDLLKLGIKGEKIGETLNHLLFECIMDSSKNNHKKLVELSKKFIN